MRISTAASGSGSAGNDDAHQDYVSYAQRYLAARAPLVATIKVMLDDAAAGRAFSVSTANDLATTADLLTKGIVTVANTVAPRGQ